MKLSRAQIQYLLIIYEMLEKGPVRLRDVAEILQVSKPSVHGMEEQFVRLGLLEKKRYMPIRMTEAGVKTVREYKGQLALLSGYLEKSLDLPREEAEESALALLGEWTEAYRRHVYGCLYAKQEEKRCGL